MKRSVVLSAPLTVLLLLSSTVIAAAVDIVPYMGLKSGRWSILQKANSTSQQGSVVAKGTNGQILRNWYNNDGTGWTFDSSEVIEISSTALHLIGVNDGTDLWTYEPVMTIPRKLGLKKPVYYNGALRNQRTQAVQRITQVFMITASGFTVSSPVGAFKNCIKVRTYEYSTGISRDAVDLVAPGRNQVKHWRSKIKDAMDPVVETQTVSSYELLQFGDSDAPFP